MAFEAQDEFFIAKLLIEAGVEVPVGSPMMVTVEDESFIAAFSDYVPPANESTAADVTPPAVAAPVIEKVVAAPIIAVTPAAPLVVVPVAVAPPKAVPAPVAAIPIAVVSSPAVAQISNGVYSVKWSTGAVAKSAIANKLSKDQNSYILKYGKSGQKPLTV